MQPERSQALRIRKGILEVNKDSRSSQQITLVEDFCHGVQSTLNRAKMFKRCSYLQANSGNDVRSSASCCLEPLVQKPNGHSERNHSPPSLPPSRWPADLAEQYEELKSKKKCDGRGSSP